jgi:hypothetical protein
MEMSDTSSEILKIKNCMDLVRYEFHNDLHSATKTQVSTYITLPEKYNNCVSILNQNGYKAILKNNQTLVRLNYNSY